MNGPDGGRTTGIRAWIESTKSAGLSDGARKRLRILAIPMAARSSRSNRSSTNASGFAATILCGAQCGGREILQIDRNDQFSPRVKGRRQYVPIVRSGRLSAEMRLSKPEIEAAFECPLFANPLPLQHSLRSVET